MATYTVTHAKTAQLTAATVDTVHLSSAWELVEIVNLTGNAEIWVRLDGVDPAVNGDDSLVLPAGMGAITLPVPEEATPEVRLVSTGTPRYHVRGV